jgi:hypothetical protein
MATMADEIDTRPASVSSQGSPVHAMEDGDREEGEIAAAAPRPSFPAVLPLEHSSRRA